MYLDGALFKMDHHPMEVERLSHHPECEGIIRSHIAVDGKACTAGHLFRVGHTARVNDHLS